MVSIKRILLLDLDRTVRVAIHGEYCHVDNQQLIEGAKDRVDRYKSEGYQVIGCTNQGGVFYKHKTLDECIEEQRITMRSSGIDTVFFCPDMGATLYRVTLEDHQLVDELPEHNLWYRKPGPGMLLQAIQYALDNKVIIQGIDDIPRYVDALMVGDQDTDKDAAFNAGVDFMWADEWLREDSLIPRSTLDKVYRERNMLAILAAQLANRNKLPSGWGLDSNGRVVVYIQLEDNYQVSWHMDRELELVAKSKLPPFNGEWDGSYLGKGMEYLDILC